MPYLISFHYIAFSHVEKSRECWIEDHPQTVQPMLNSDLLH